MTTVSMLPSPLVACMGGEDIAWRQMPPASPAPAVLAGDVAREA
jgi:hypothetical protein